MQDQKFWLSNPHPWCGTRPSFLPQYSPQCQPAGPPTPASPAQWSTYPGVTQGPHFSPSTHHSASLLGLLHQRLQLNDLHILVWHKALISPPVLTPVPACWASSTCVSSSMIYIPWCDTRPSFLPQYSPQCQPAGSPPPVSPAQWSTYPGVTQGPHFSPSTHHSASLLDLLHLRLQLNDLHTLVWHKVLISPPVLTTVPACWVSSTCVSSSMIYIPWCDTRSPFLPQYSPQCQPTGPPPVSPAQWSTYPSVTQGLHFSPSTHHSASLLGLLHLCLQLNDLQVGMFQIRLSLLQLLLKAAAWSITSSLRGRKKVISMVECERDIPLKL